MKIAVTGGTGMVGRFVVAELLAAGHDVVALARPDSVLDGFATAPAWLTGTLEDAGALTRLLAGCDALVHCAFDHVPGRYRGGEGTDPVRFWQVNLQGTQRLLETALSEGVTRAVLLSSRAVFGARRAGESPTDPVVDDHPLWPDTHYGAMKAATEALCGVYGAQGVCCAALRPTGVYGIAYPPEASKWYALVQDARRGAARAS